MQRQADRRCASVLGPCIVTPDSGLLYISGVRVRIPCIPTARLSQVDPTRFYASIISSQAFSISPSAAWNVPCAIRLLPPPRPFSAAFNFLLSSLISASADPSAYFHSSFSPEQTRTTFPFFCSYSMVQYCLS